MLSRPCSSEKIENVIKFYVIANQVNLCNIWELAIHKQKLRSLFQFQSNSKLYEMEWIIVNNDCSVVF